MNVMWNWWAVPGTFVFFAALTCAVIAIRTAPRRTLNLHLGVLLILEGVQLGSTTGFLFFFENREIVRAFATCGTVATIALPFQYLSFLAVALKTPLVAPFQSRAAFVVLGMASVIGGTLVLTNSQMFISELYSPDFAPWNFQYEGFGIWVVQFQGATTLYGLVAAVSAYIYAKPGSAARNRAKWFAIAFGVRDAFVGIVLIMFPILRPIPFWGDFIANQVYAMVYMIYVLLLAYAVLKMQLFDIDLKVKFVIQKGTLVALVGGLFLIGSELLEALVPVQSTFLGVAVAVVILVLLRPIQRLALRMVGGIMKDVGDTPDYLEARKLDVYRAAVEGAFEDGMITQKEERILERLRDSLELSEAETNAIEQNFNLNVDSVVGIK